MPILDTYRKQAKLLQRWHSEGNHSIGGKVRLVPRYSTLSDREALAMAFPLALAQEITAIEAGYANWAELKVASEGAVKVLERVGAPLVLSSITPILLSRDVTKAAEHYRDRLGFIIDFLHGQPPFYAGLSRDGVCIHLRYCRAPGFAATAASEVQLLLATIEVSDVKAMFAELEKRGAEIAHPLTKQAWGGTDFHVRDLDGNVISFVSY